jgi:hypothetical protein
MKKSGRKANGEFVVGWDWPGCCVYGPDAGGDSTHIETMPMREAVRLAQTFPCGEKELVIYRLVPDRRFRFVNGKIVEPK